MKNRPILIGILLILVSGFVHSNPKQLQLLDPVYYVNIYPDLKNAFGNNMEQAKNHWLTIGINEGRESAPWFSVKSYCQRYPDLKAHFNNCTNHRGAVDHFISNGRVEGRDPSPASKADHRLRVLDEQFYLDNYPDLKKAFGSNLGQARNHWLQYGINEGRQGSYGFSTSAYIGHSTTLLKTLGNNYSAALLHFTDNGIREDRNFTPVPRTDLSGRLIQGQGDSRVFFVDAKGRLLHVRSPQAANECGLDLGTVQTIPKAEMLIITIGGFLSNKEDCTQLGVTTVAKRSNYSGNIDPIAELIKKVPAVSNFFSPLKGAIQLENASGPSLETFEVFKVAGSFSPNQLGGNSEFAQILQYAVKASLGMFGALQSKVNMEVGLKHANNEWDLSIGVSIFDTFAKAPAVPTIGTQFAAKNAKMVFHVKVSTGAPVLTQELTGTFFVRPTGRDPWIGLTPTFEVAIDGSATVGGEFTGACRGDINSSTETGQCINIWSVLNLGAITSKGGQLKVDIDAKTASPTGIEAFIKEGSMMGQKVDGAIKTDLDASPGFGVVVKLSGSQGTNPAAIMKLMPFSSQEPLKTAINLLSAVPVSEIGRVTGAGAPQGEFVITPTGLQVGHINMGPGMAVKGLFNGVIYIDSKIEADVAKILQGNLSGAKTAYFNGSISFNNINSMVKSGVSSTVVLAPFASEISSTFRLDNLGFNVDLGKQTAGGVIDFSVAGKNVKASVPLDIVMRPDRVAPHIVKEIEYLFADLGKIILQGMEQAGREISKGATVVGEGFIGGMGEVGKAFEDLGGSISNAIGGLFGSSPNNWDKTSAAYPAHVFDVSWFQRMHRPNDTDLWRTIYIFHNPFIKQHVHGWSPWFDPDYYLDNNPDILAAAKSQEQHINNLVWGGAGGVYAWKRPGGHNAAIDNSYFTTDTASGVNAAGNLAPQRGKYQAFQRYFAFDHYMKAGINEQRVANYYLNPKYYAYKYPDIAKAYKGQSVTKLFEHYLNAGEREGRQGRPIPPPGYQKIPHGVAELPCRALVDNRLLFGNWYHAARSVVCEVAFGPNVHRLPVFDVLMADGGTQIPFAKGFPYIPGQTLPVPAQNKDWRKDYLCVAINDSGQNRFGYRPTDNEQSCWVPGNNGKSMPGKSPHLVYLTNPRFVVP